MMKTHVYTNKDHIENNYPGRAQVPETKDRANVVPEVVLAGEGRYRDSRYQSCVHGASYAQV